MMASANIHVADPTTLLRSSSHLAPSDQYVSGVCAANNAPHQNFSMDAKSEIYLIRHGETDWNIEGRFQGHKDSPLTARGHVESEQLGRRLALVLAERATPQMFVSPLGRARGTANILRTFLKYRPSITDVRLREVTIGSWDGLTQCDIETRSPGVLNGSTPFNWYFRAPDGESYAAGLERARAWLEEIDGTIVAVSHAVTGRLIRAAYLGLSRQEALCLPAPQNVIWRLHGGQVDGIVA